MNLKKTYTMPIYPGWLLAMEETDMERWEPESIMPKILAAVAHADGTVKPTKNPVVSDDLMIDVEPAACFAVLMRFPVSPSRLRGVVWIGLRHEVAELRESMRPENMKRFKAVAIDPESN